MSHLSKRCLFWAPRALSIVFVAFLSLFAMDVFSEHLGLWRTALALTMHLIPSFVLIAALILANTGDEKQAEALSRKVQAAPNRRERWSS